MELHACDFHVLKPAPQDKTTFKYPSFISIITGVLRVYIKLKKVEETVVCRCSTKKLFLKTLQNPYENTCVFLIVRLEAGNFIRLQHRYLCEFCKIFQNAFFAEDLQTTATAMNCVILVFL